MANDNAKSGQQQQPYWLIYVALLIGGILLLADAYYFIQLTKWTAKLGIALVYSAIAMFIGNGRWAGNLATVIVWVAVILTYVL